MPPTDAHAPAPLSVARRLELWDRALDLVRRALRGAGMREVSTPVRVDAAAAELDLEPVGAPPGYLAASHEHAMKRLLCLGSGPLFQVSHAFRGGERGPLHREEFHLVEWLRCTEGARELQGDVEALVGCCFEAADRAPPARWHRVGLLDLLEETLGLALRGDEDAESLRAALAGLGEARARALLARAPSGPAGPALSACTWEAFLAQWRADALAPWLAARPGSAVHLGDFPAALCARAATGEAGWAHAARPGQRLAHRFESFVGGVECASGHRALRDAEEQLRRVEQRNAQRTLAGRLPLPLDRDYLAALRSPGLPACAGGSLGLDRALLVACGARELREVTPHLEPARAPDGEAAHERSRRVVSVGGLLRRGLATEAQRPALEAVERKLAVGLTRTMLGQLQSAEDPLGRQFVPDARELERAPQERPDPIGDEAHAVSAGLIHRYRDRALLKPTHLCAVYCRFCFRRDVVGDPAEATLAPEAMEAALEEIRRRPELWEVILTGGDPLLLAPSRLAALLEKLRAIPHVRVLRVHTRVPLVAPERVTPALLRALRGSKPLYVVLHANHAAEFTPEGAAACAALVDAGLPMLSQTVLLAGVNDSEEALETLLRAFVEHRIKPYYLHHPDLVEGTSHLRVSLREGRRLVRSLRGRVSGLCQPVYVLDIPGGYGKVPAAEAWVHGPEADGSFRVTDPSGAEHSYQEPPARER